MRDRIRHRWKIGVYRIEKAETSFGTGVIPTRDIPREKNRNVAGEGTAQEDIRMNSPIEMIAEMVRKVDPIHHLAFGRIKAGSVDETKGL
jgi:hypothetical protein